MGRSLWLKQNGIHALWVLVITLAFVSVCAWTVPVSETWVLWAFRLFVTPLAAVAAGIWLYRVSVKPRRSCRICCGKSRGSTLSKAACASRPRLRRLHREPAS